MFTIKHHIKQCFSCFILVIEVLEGLRDLNGNEGLKGAQEGLKGLEGLKGGLQGLKALKEGLKGLKGLEGGLNCQKCKQGKGTFSEFGITQFYVLYKIKYHINNCSGCKIIKGYPCRIHHNLKILDIVEGAEDWEGCRENCNYMGEAHFTPNYCTHFVYNVSFLTFLPSFLIRIFCLLKTSDSTCTLLGLNYTRSEKGPWISGAKSCPKCKISKFFWRYNIYYDIIALY